MTPIIGSRRAWDSALAAATPTRRPVNSPGPRSTAMAPMSPSSTRVCRQRNSIAGVSVSAWRRPRVDWMAPSTPSWPPMAQPTWAVDVVIPRMSISARRLPGAEHAGQRVGARAPSAAPTARKADVAVVVADRRR